MTHVNPLRPWVIDGVQIIDGTGKPPLPDGRVTIVGGYSAVRDGVVEPAPLLWAWNKVAS